MLAAAAADRGLRANEFGQRNIRWRTIAVRALGGWIAAIGLMMGSLVLALSQRQDRPCCEISQDLELEGKPPNQAPK
ncbi:hypothetical protein [Bradyrhizobium sp. DASA03120]|uniref:hypothetical protein n=1 Tax=Bradyrhizobium sp. SMVTL-02 TaxID=3395917 RepID=UPI003F70F33A